MDDARPPTCLPDDLDQLKALIAGYQHQLAQQQAAIAKITQQRDQYYIEKLRLEVRLAQALKQTYGPRADRLRDPGQLLLDFAQTLESLPVRHGDLPPEEDRLEPATGQRRGSRRLGTRGRRDIGQLKDLPLIEQNYELTEEQCRCPVCQGQRDKIGSEISYTIEHIPATFVRIKHVQYKYACRHCEHNGDSPHIELAAKTGGSPIDKGLPGPGLLAYVATSKYADYLPLHRLQGIFQRNGFELDRSTMCLWMADVARLVRPIHDRMVEQIRQSQVLATDDTVMPLLQPGRTRQARMWIYLGDDSHPYNIFDFTVSRSRDGPNRFLKNFRNTLLADAYGGYDGVVVNQNLRRAGCWAHARRKFVDAQAAGPDLARAIVRLIQGLFNIEDRARDLSDNDRLRLRQAESQPLLDQKAQLLPKHPMTEAINYALNHWPELTEFVRFGNIPIHNNLAEQQMKRIALLRKNALFVGTVRGGETAAVISSITSTCRRHGINPQVYLTQLLAGLQRTPMSRLDEWLPDRWKAAQPSC